MQLQRLNERRTLSVLVDLLRDSAYAAVRLPVKMQQLAHLCAAELAHIDTRPTRPLEVAYLSGRNAAKPGAIDSGGWTLASDAFPTGVSALTAGQAGAAYCSDDGSAADGFELRRAVVTANFPAGETERQQVAFACDAAVALRSMLDRAGTVRDARLNFI